MDLAAAQEAEKQAAQHRFNEESDPFGPYALRIRAKRIQTFRLNMAKDKYANFEQLLASERPGHWQVRSVTCESSVVVMRPAWRRH